MSNEKLEEIENELMSIQSALWTSKDVSLFRLWVRISQARKLIKKKLNSLI